MIGRRKHDLRNVIHGPDGSLVARRSFRSCGGEDSGNQPPKQLNAYETVG